VLAEVQFTAARSSFTELFDSVWHRCLPAVVRRRQAEEVLLLRRDLVGEVLKAYRLRPEVLPEEDGSVTLAVDELELAVNAPTLEGAVKELARELKLYARDYLERLPLFLNAPNRRGHFPYMLRVWLCETDEEIEGLLEM